VRVASAEPLDPASYRELVRRALAEDLGWGDITTDALIPPEERARGVILAKSPCVIAGLAVAEETFRQIDPSVVFEARCADGDALKPGDAAVDLTGFAAGLLTAERTALNFLQRLSGIATLARRFRDAAGDHITILDTRKTTPSLRVLEKYAVRVGGAGNHRMALDDGILIKDNHLRLVGGVREALVRMRRADHDFPVEVEADTLDQVSEAIEAGADRILLDNMSIPDIVEAVRRCKGRAQIELSGGVTLERLPDLAKTGADFVSVGALTHSAPAVDLSLELEPAPSQS
jgi:nicotinate-nucleotide pyrophosphorylase (carboxylating)